MGIVEGRTGCSAWWEGRAGLCTALENNIHRQSLGGIDVHGALKILALPFAKIDLTSMGAQR